MESELQQYLNKVGLSVNMLKPSSSAQVDDDGQPTPSTVSNVGVDESEDDDGVETAQPDEPVVDVILADNGLVSGTTVTDGNEGDMKVSDCSPAVTASLTDDSRCVAADSSSTEADDTCSEDLVEYVAPLIPSNNDSQPSALQEFSADDNVVQSSQQQTVAINGNVAQLDCTEVPSEILQSSSRPSRSAVVFSTVPRHVDNASTMTASQISHPQTTSSSLSSCTVVLSGPVAADVTSSPKAHRSAGDGHERSQADVAAPTLRPSLDAISYTSTIIRCSASSAPVIATSTSKSRDPDASATAIDELETPPPAKPHIKTTPNYVSVVRIGSTTPGTSVPVNERHTLPVTATPADSINGGLDKLHSSPLATTSDVVSSTPMKSSLKKLSPGHAKTKSVSFSTGSANDNGEDDTTATATSTETSNARRPDAHHPSLTEAIGRLDRDRVDGIVPRALVSDSGVFCEHDDELASFGGDDSKATTTQPSRRTTVIVSGGMASVKNRPGHHQHDQSADLAATKPDSWTSSRTLNVSSSPGSVRPQQVSTPASSAVINVSDINETKQSTTQDTTNDARRETYDASQVTSSFCHFSLYLCFTCRFIFFVFCIFFFLIVGLSAVLWFYPWVRPPEYFK